MYWLVSTYFQGIYTRNVQYLFKFAICYLKQTFQRIWLVKCHVTRNKCCMDYNIIIVIMLIFIQIVMEGHYCSHSQAFQNGELWVRHVTRNKCCMDYNIIIVIMLIFIQIVMEGHIISATLKHFKMENCESDLPATLTRDLKSTEGKSAFHEHILHILTGLVNLPIRPGKETIDRGSHACICKWSAYIKPAKCRIWRCY